MKVGFSLVRSRGSHGPRYRRFETPAPKGRFSTVGELLALGAMMIILLVMLFPKRLIERQFNNSPSANAASIAYLRLQLRAEPNDTGIRARLAREQLRAGQLLPAEYTMQPLLGSHPDPITARIWLRLQHARYVAVSHTLPQWPAARAHYAQMLRQFGPDLFPVDMLQAARQALADGLYPVAGELAQSVLVAHVANGPAVHTSALALTDHSADEAHLVGLIWGLRPATLRERPLASNAAPISAAGLRQQAFAVLLDIQLAAGRPDAALTLAQQHVGQLDPATARWPQLIQIAQWAGDPAAGADFARRWLRSTTDPDARWTAFNALIASYLAAAQPKLALHSAEAELQRMPPTPALWRVMTRLAIQAGDSDASALYARRLVTLENPHAS